MTFPPQVDKNSNTTTINEHHFDDGIEITEIDLRDEISISESKLVEKTPSNSFKTSSQLIKRTSISLLAIIIILAVVIYTEQGIFVSKVLPGIEIGNINFGNKSKSDAKKLLDEKTDKILGTPFILTLDGKTFSVSSQDFELKYDNKKTVDKAYALDKTFLPTGAVASFFGRHIGTENVIPIYSVDKDKFELVIQNLSDKLSSGRVDAGITIEGTNVRVQQPVSGIGVTPAVIKAELIKSFETLSSRKINLTKKKVEASISANEATSKATLIKTIFAENTILTTPAGNTVTITPEQIATTLSVIPDGKKLNINIDEAKLRATIADQLSAAEVAPVDATFATNGSTVSVIASVTGKKIDLASSIKSIANGNHQIAAAVIDDVPAHNTEWANSLNITELVSTFTTNFPAGQVRVKNIAKAASVVDGTVIEPGQTFSLNDKLGKRTAESGYFKAPVYVGGEDTFAEDFGGGISQFTTTMFNAAWIAGYKDISHTPHSIYISRYPMGREATLNYGSIDLKIQDDYKSGILVRTYVGPTSVTVSLYGNKEGRQVTLEGPNILGETPVENQYTDDPNLEVGKEIKTASGYPGSVVENFRTIKRPGLPDKRDRLTWKYVMVPNKITRGTKVVAVPAT